MPRQQTLPNRCSTSESERAVVHQIPSSMAAIDGADPLDDLTMLSVADLLTALTSNEVKPTDPRLEELKTALAQSGPAEAAVEEPAATAAAAVEEAVAPDATAAAVPETGRGCYLMAEETSGGTLNIQWSETAVEGAIAFCNPTKNVPKFKFTQNGGKREVSRGTNTRTKITAHRPPLASPLHHPTSLCAGCAVLSSR